MCVTEEVGIHKQPSFLFIFVSRRSHVTEERMEVRQDLSPQVGEGLARAQGVRQRVLQVELGAPVSAPHSCVGVLTPSA